MNKGTKYTKEYCQEILNSKNSGWKVIDYIEGINSKENMIVIQCRNSNHIPIKTKAYRINDSKLFCSQCVQDNKYNEIKEYVEENTKYTFMDFEYICDKNRYLVYIQDDIYKYCIEWSNLKKNTKPSIVGKWNPYSLNNICKYIEINNLKHKYHSGEYISSTSPMFFKCETCDEIFETTWDSINSKKGCPYCGGKKVNSKNSFVLNYPELAKEFDYDKNSIDINSLTVGSGRSIWFICSKCNHSYISSPRTKVYGVGCPNCKIINCTGENNARWNGGLTEIYYYLRLKINPWKFDSSDFYKKKCIITNKHNDIVIHHVYKPFANIVEECYCETNIEKKRTIGEYSQEELIRLSELCLKKHYEYGFGIPLNAELHNEFHNTYGRKNTTMEMLLDFSKNKGVDIANIV